MTPIQQMMLGLGGATKTYVDDVFSTNVWAGDASGSRVITTNIDQSGEGCLTWVKSRSAAEQQVLVDTVRGVSKILVSSSSGAESGNVDVMTEFTSSGFKPGTHDSANGSGKTYAGWTFRKAPGFFDVVTWTGTASAQLISHSLGSVPGLIMIKCTSDAENWVIYHRDISPASYLRLNTTAAEQTDSGGSVFNGISATDTTFSVGTHALSNGNGNTYVAYLYAGGESTAATARSVDFDGNDGLALSSHNNWDLLNNSFTIEMWVRSGSNATAQNYPLINHGSSGDYAWKVDFSSADQAYNHWTFQYSTNGTSWNNIISGERIDDDQWHHIAVVRDSTYIKLYTDGKLETTHTHSGATFHNSPDPLKIAYISDNSRYYTGDISNVRVVNGTAVYTSSFRPPTQPLTDITNTVLLCCNNSSVTGSTNSSGESIGAVGDPTASTDSPFDDPAAHIFGKSGSGNLIKCGSYVGNGSATHFKIDLGFEPQWLMIKRVTGGTSQWTMADMMRGTPADDPTNASQDGPFLWANQDWAEATDRPFTTHSTGFGLKNTSTSINASGDTYVYMAIRRPDGYVGKPASAGTDAFAIDTGTNVSVPPSFDSGFPVGFALRREVYQSGTTTPVAAGWHAGARLLGEIVLTTHDNAAQATSADARFDANNGWSIGYPDNYYSWMWKRGAGMDVVAYTGDAVDGRTINHSMNAVPEMIWVKNRTTSGNTGDWMVGHKDLNGGSSPWNYYLVLNKTQGEYSDNNPFNNSTPTTTSFEIDSWDRVNASGSGYLAMLFSSVTGISKVGSYTGSGSSNTQTITTGFQPRFLIVKDYTGPSNPWYVMDTTRGWAGGDDKQLMLDDTYQELTNDWGAPTATGFTVTSNGINNNSASNKYIYYAHA
tara:strand:+ start:921 stop:3572 length:2652 start_codon:yes stop_codon:yes gene_type:complete